MNSKLGRNILSHCFGKNPVYVLRLVKYLLTGRDCEELKTEMEMQTPFQTVGEAVVCYTAWGLISKLFLILKDGLICK